MQRTITLLYFKSSGKYYWEGTLETYSSNYDLLGEIKELQKNKKLPGLMEGVSEYFIIIMIPLKLGGYDTRMLIPPEWEIKERYTRILANSEWGKE